MNYSLVYLDLVSYVLFLCLLIPSWVFFMLLWQLLSRSGVYLLGSEDNVVELIWTIIPTFFVLGLCYLNLYCIGAKTYHHARDVIKVIGRQWYWEYEVVGGGSSYDSLMLDYIDSVDKPLRLSYNLHHNLLITSADVIHSFAVPGMNIKMDAVPGRINQVFVCPDRLGVFVGYCSELCGAGHAYMPIVVEVVIPKPVVKVVAPAPKAGFWCFWKWFS